jgi:hydrogenase maturation protease
VLVLGLGNILLSDEGVGVRVVETLRARYHLPGVEVLDGGTAGMDLIDVIAGRRHLLIVDAVKDGGRPGSLLRLTGADVKPFFRQRLSPHQLGLPDVLAFLELMDAAPASLTVIGIEPKSLDLGVELSPELLAAVDAAMAAVVEDLRARGVEVVPRDDLLAAPPANQYDR